MYKKHEEILHQRGYTDEEHMSSCSASLAIREMQNEGPMTYLCTPIKMAKTKNSDNIKCWCGHPYSMAGNVKQYSTSGKHFVSFS